MTCRRVWNKQQTPSLFHVTEWFRSIQAWNQTIATTQNKAMWKQRIMQCAQKEWSIGWTVHCFTIVNVSGISVCIHKLRWDLEWRRMPNSYEFWLQFRHEITVRFPKFLTNIFGSFVEIPDVHHELNYAVIKKIANLRTEGINFTWKFEVRKLRVSQVRRSTSKLLLKLNRYFIMADLSTWMETFKDKRDYKSYQLIFDILVPRAFFPGFGRAGKGHSIGRSHDQ